MAGIRTHYDNLQVARSASPEVIRAAHRGLSQRYHPDRNPHDRERCERIMKAVNKAYEVLSDPASRSEHDAWIVREEAAEQRPAMGRPAEEDNQRATEEQAGKLTGAVSSNWEKSSTISFVLVALIVKFLSTEYDGLSVSFLLAPTFVGICALLAMGVRCQRSNLRIEAANYFAIGAGIANAAVTAYTLKADGLQLAPSIFALAAATACWFSGTFVSVRIAVGSLASASPVVGFHPKLSLTRAYLLFSASCIVNVAGNYMASPTGVDAAFSAARSTPPHPTSATLVAVLVTAVLIGAALSIGIASLLLRFVAPVLRWMRFQPENRPSWALIVVVTLSIASSVWLTSIGS